MHKTYRSVRFCWGWWEKNKRYNLWLRAGKKKKKGKKSKWSASSFLFSDPQFLASSGELLPLSTVSADTGPITLICTCNQSQSGERSCTALANNRALLLYYPLLSAPSHDVLSGHLPYNTGQSVFIIWTLQIGPASSVCVLIDWTFWPGVGWFGSSRAVFFFVYFINADFFCPPSVFASASFSLCYVHLLLTSCEGAETSNSRTNN